MHYPQNTYNSIPKFYIETLRDKIISIDTQRKLQRKANFKKIYTLDASHSPFVSKPKELAADLIDIARQV